VSLWPKGGDARASFELSGKSSVDHRPHSAARRRALPHRFVSPNGLTALAVSLLLAFGLPPQAAQAQEAPVRVSIAAQPLGSALVRIANEYSLELAYSPDIAVGRNAPAVSGNLTATRHCAKCWLARASSSGAMAGTCRCRGRSSLR